MTSAKLFCAAALAAGALLAQDAPQPPEPPAGPESRAERERARAEERTRAAQERAKQVQERVREAHEQARALVALSGSSYIGIGVAEVDSERAKALKLPEVHGVEVKNVTKDGPAAKAGIKEEDVILEYNDQRVEGTNQLIRMVRETPPGRQARLSIWRGGAPQSVTLTVSKRAGRTVQLDDGREYSINLPEVRMPEIQVRMPEIRILDLPSPMMSWRNSVLGIEGEALESQLAEYFGVKQGVLVRSVLKGTAAAKAGIKAGDVILKVDGNAVTTPREISAALRGRREGPRTVPVVLMRERREMTVNVTLEAASRLAPPERAEAAPAGLDQTRRGRGRPPHPNTPAVML